MPLRALTRSILPSLLPTRPPWAGAALACLLVVSIGCAANPSGGLRDAGVDAGTAEDAGSPPGPDAASERQDAGPPLPERCSDENMFFEDEFGRMAYCIYVAPDGDDAAQGTPDEPFATIGHAIEVAVARGVATGRIHAVAVSRGVYEERVILANGVSVYGKFDAADGWSRAEGNETTIDSGEVVGGRIEGVVADEISAPTVLEGFTVTAGPAPVSTEGVDVYGIRVAGSTPVLEELGGLVLRDLEVRARNTSAGTDGAAGAMGDSGSQGGEGDPGDKDNGDRNDGGIGAVTVCGAVTVETTRGGDGGEGGGDDAMGCGTYREDAGAGSPPPALASCAGGTAGDACSCVDPVDYEGSAGGPGYACGLAAAEDGAAAPAPAARGSVLDGLWVALPGADGEPGSPGLGGSGGGGGGSGCDAAGWGPTGGGGGGGGSGGCGGAGGGGGGSGGSSFGLLVAGSTIAIHDSSFSSGTAADGGAGAAGGPGGEGGPGGPGGSGGHDGGVGGAGQAGGGGGPGAGGPGGSSVAAFLCDSTADGLELGALDAGVAGAAGVAAEGGRAGVAGFAGPYFEGCEL